MARLKKLTPRKDPVQKRSLELRNALLEAATYILRKDGARGFTTNKVAEKAGVNIASFYQYYPNKEALLFHLVEIEWEATYQSVFPILADQRITPAKRLAKFIEAFYETEADEGILRNAVGACGIELENTENYQKLTEKTDVLFRTFLNDAGLGGSARDVERQSQFIQGLIFGYSDSADWATREDLKREARMMSEMICGYFGIS